MSQYQSMPLIANIQTTDLLYYDPAYGAAAYQFCRDRDIDCLLCIGDPNLFYRRNDETQDFDPETLTKERKLSALTSIFRPDLLKRFRHQPVMFVQNNDQLTGAVHFADYNKPLVSEYLYACLAEYERNLRCLAELCGLKDEDMGSYFREKQEEKREKGTEQAVGYFQNKIDAFERQRDQRARMPLFQSYYLEDLIRLLKHRDIILLQGKVIDLRNSVMHARELVNIVDVNTPDFIYDFSTFESFFGRVRALLEDSRRVANRIKFMSGAGWAAAAGLIEIKGWDE